MVVTYQDNRNIRSKQITTY